MERTDGGSAASASAKGEAALPAEELCAKAYPRRLAPLPKERPPRLPNLRKGVSASPRASAKVVKGVECQNDQTSPTSPKESDLVMDVHFTPYVEL